MLVCRIFALAAGMLVAGCAANVPQQVENQRPLPQPREDGTYAVKMPDLGRGVARERKLATGPSEPVRCTFSPHFAFRSAEPLPQDRIALEDVADCLNQDEARDRAIEVIGHADVRGNAATNDALALQRARRVREILTEHGVAWDRIRVKSVGERASLGFLPSYSHGFDRRVDVTLASDRIAPSDTDRYEVSQWR